MFGWMRLNCSLNFYCRRDCTTKIVNDNVSDNCYGSNMLELDQIDLDLDLEQLVIPSWYWTLSNANWLFHEVSTSFTQFPHFYNNLLMLNYICFHWTFPHTVSRPVHLVDVFCQCTLVIMLNSNEECFSIIGRQKVHVDSFCIMLVNIPRMVTWSVSKTLPVYQYIPPIS